MTSSINVIIFRYTKSMFGFFQVIQFVLETCPNRRQFFIDMTRQLFVQGFLQEFCAHSMHNGFIGTIVKELFFFFEGSIDANFPIYVFLRSVDNADIAQS